jgi:nucleoside-diphosphate-sugar epimerase
MTMYRGKEDRTMQLPPTIGVTGAAGFIGANLCERLLDEGCTVIGVDDMSMGTLRNMAGLLDHPNFRFEEFDCRDAARMREAMGECDAIAHMAALKIPRYGGALKTLAVNVDGSHVALELGRETGAHVVLASTSDVYGQAEPPFHEDDPIVLGPPTTRRWSYAASKYFDEHLALRMAEEEGLKVTILRFFNAYGVRNHPSWWGGPLSVFFEDLLDGKDMEIHGDGRQTRSFTYVSDTVDGVVRALARPETSGEVINIGNDQPIEIIELARKVQEAMGIEGDLRVNHVGLEELGGNYQDVRHRVPSLEKAKRLLGFEPKVSLEEGLAKTLAWHLELRAEAVEAA